MMPHKDPEQACAYFAAYYARHKEERRAQDAAYRAVHKEEIVAYGAAYYATHKEEHAASQKAYRASHRKELAAYGVAYRVAHRALLRQRNAEKERRRRAFKRGATIGPIDLVTIKIRDRMVCCICGKKVMEKDLSFDHSHPLVLGGMHSQENLRVAHLCCNIRRGAGRLPVQMVLV